MRCTLLLLLSALAGCAFEPGDPWASAAFSLNAEFDEAGRTADGRLRTAQDYRVELDTVEVHVTAARINLAPEGTEAFFDPANPPEGFSLCHNGHCHAADGSLVDYADVAAAGGTTAATVVQAVDAVVWLDSQSQAVPLGSCSGSCEVPRGVLQDVQLDVGYVRLSGRAFDSREPSRLPDEGVPFDLSTSPMSPRSAVSGEVGEGRSAQVRVVGALTISAHALDAIDFASPPAALDVTNGLEWVAIVER